MGLSARCRLLLARRPWLYWMFVGVVAAVAGGAVARATATIDDARRSWGLTDGVQVASAAAAPGEPIVAAIRELPEAMVPPDALREIEPGATARQHVAAGEVLVAHDTAAPAGPAALVPVGWRAVAVAEPVASGVGVGDRVEAASGGIVLADDGLVVATTAEAVLVAVPATAAAQVAAAAVQGDLVLLLVP